MAERIVFRGEGGRFISRAQAEEEFAGTVEIFDPLAGTRTVIDASEYFDQGLGEQQAELGYIESDWERGIVWDDFVEDFGEFEADHKPPGGVDFFRVFTDVEGNPDYPRGMASTGWLDIQFWPPSLDMIRGVDASGYNQIRFRRS